MYYQIGGGFASPYFKFEEVNMRKSGIRFVVIVLLVGLGIVSSGEVVNPSVASKSQTKKAILPLAEKLPPLPVRPKVHHSPTQIVVRVNGSNITYGAIEKYVNFMAFLLKNRSPKISDQKLKDFKNKNFKRFSDDLFLKTLISTNLSSSNITVSAESRSFVEKSFLRNYGGKKQTVQQLRNCAEKSGYGDELEKILSFESTMMTFLTTVHSNRYYVTDAEVKKHKANVLNYNKRASATNDLHRALANSIYQRSIAGEDFKKLQIRYSQDPKDSPDRKEINCDEHDFEDNKHVWQVIKNLKADQVSPVIELEDGFAIYKLIRRIKGTESNSGEDASVVSRIFFRKAFLFEEQSDEDFRQDVERELREALMRDIVLTFRKQSVVERPNGQIEVY